MGTDRDGRHIEDQELVPGGVDPDDTDDRGDIEECGEHARADQGAL